MAELYEIFDSLAKAGNQSNRLLIYEKSKLSDHLQFLSKQSICDEDRRAEMNVMKKIWQECEPLLKRLSILETDSSKLYRILDFVGLPPRSKQFNHERS